MKKTRWIFIAVLLIFSCNSANKEKTRIFSDYLSSTFSLTIPDETHYFVLLPQFVCAGCVYNSQIALNKYLDDHSALISSITFIYSHLRLANAELIQRVSSFYDEQHNMDNNIPSVSFGIGNLTIVKTKNGSVIKVASIDIAELDHFAEMMQKILN